MFLLDTDTLTLIHAGNSLVLQKQKQVPSSEIAITIVTWVEILQGRFSYLLKAADSEHLPRAQEFLKRSQKRLAELTILGFDQEAGRIFDQLRGNARYRKLGRADLLIASIALSRRAVLVTRNLRHFQVVPGLAVENWCR